MEQRKSLSSARFRYLLLVKGKACNQLQNRGNWTGGFVVLRPLKIPRLFGSAWSTIKFPNIHFVYLSHTPLTLDPSHRTQTLYLLFLDNPSYLCSDPTPSCFGITPSSVKKSQCYLSGNPTPLYPMFPQPLSQR